MSTIQPDIDVIIRATAKYFDLTPEALTSKARTTSLSIARQTAMYIARYLGYSYPVIGRAFNRHHTTVIFSIESIQDQRDVYDPIAQAIVTIAIELAQEIYKSASDS